MAKKVFLVIPIVLALSISMLLESQVKLEFATTTTNDVDGPSLSCRRRCPISNKNKVILLAESLPAGLSDRMEILEKFGNIAGYLCATLYVPSPTSWLLKRHNGGKLVSTSLMWRDFFDVQFLETKSSAIRQFGGAARSFSESRGYNLKNWYMISAVKEGDLDIGGHRTLQTHESNHEYSKQLKKLEEFVRFQQEGSTLAQFNATTPASDLATNDTNNFEGFLWIIGTSPFRVFSALSNKPHNNDQNGFLLPDHHSFPSISYTDDGCQYTQTIPSTGMRDLRNEVFDRIKTKFPDIESFGFLHIRRGDTTRDCNTTLERMSNYLTCSLNCTEVDNLGNNALLFASDERDNEYRQGMKNIVEGLGHGFVDLDETIWSVVKDFAGNDTDKAKYLNNFVVYYITGLVAGDSRVNFHFELRRQLCPDCVEVVIHRSSSETYEDYWLSSYFSTGYH